MYQRLSFSQRLQKTFVYWKKLSVVVPQVSIEDHPYNALYIDFCIRPLDCLACDGFLSPGYECLGTSGCEERIYQECHWFSSWEIEETFCCAYNRDIKMYDSHSFHHGAYPNLTWTDKDTLSSIIESSSLLKDERKHISSHYLAMLLVHDLLFARGGIQASDGPTKQAIMRHKTRLQAELVKLKVKRGVKSNHELASEGDSRASRWWLQYLWISAHAHEPLSGQIPRYVRVNTARWTFEEAIVYLTSRGFSRATSPFENKQVPWSRNESNWCFLRSSFTADDHVPDLLAFHPAVTFHGDVAYESGKFILQDKASCFPALVLSPHPDEGTVALDATAAPGNKTTHLSAIMQGKGRVWYLRLLILPVEWPLFRYWHLKEIATDSRRWKAWSLRPDARTSRPLTPIFSLLILKIANLQL